jgi:YHS domain-containing protein
MGTPIKLLIDNQPLYLCCKGCVEQVAKDPLAYLPKKDAVRPQRSESPSRGSSPVARAKAGDQAMIEAQQVCPVTGASLGSMGKPIKVTVKGETVFLCCRGCEQAIRKDPDKYLAKLSTAGQK